MRLYSAKIPALAAEIVRTLITSKDIEAEHPKDVEGDVVAVLNQYLADERDVNERAKELLERTGKNQSEYQRLRSLAADEKRIKLGDEALDYLLDQVVEMLMHSNNVDEVYAADIELRRKMAPIFKKHMAIDATVDAEVRTQLRHVREGTREWEIEYARVLEQVRRRKGL